MKAKVLLIDIETAPILANVWGLFKQNVGLNQIRQDPYILSWAAKWLGDGSVYYDALPYHSLYKEERENDAEIVATAWEMLNDADIVVGHNARNFDVKWLNARFLVHGMEPPAPYKIVDTLLVAKSRLKLASNRLDYLAQVLGIDGKLSTDFSLWADCIAGDKQAWRDMVDYNIQDVYLLEDVYNKLLPWMASHPNVTLYDEDEELRCKNCGSSEMNKDGKAYTQVGVYQKYRCKSCGHPSRSGVNLTTKEKRQSTTRSIPHG